mgnify:CR=1 FL=1
MRPPPPSVPALCPFCCGASSSSLYTLLTGREKTTRGSTRGYSPAPQGESHTHRRHQQGVLRERALLEERVVHGLCCCDSLVGVVRQHTAGGEAGTDGGQLLEKKQTHTPGDKASASSQTAAEGRCPWGTGPRTWTPNSCVCTKGRHVPCEVARWHRRNTTQRHGEGGSIITHGCCGKAFFFRTGKLVTPGQSASVGVPRVLKRRLTCPRSSCDPKQDWTVSMGAAHQISAKVEAHNLSGEERLVQQEFPHDAAD